MRITNGMLSSSLLGDLNTNMQRLGGLQQQIASGRRIANLSDDPIGVITAMQARVKLQQIDRCRAGVHAALDMNTQVETALMELNSMAKSAYETAVRMASGTFNEEDRTAAASAVAQMRDHVLALGNGKFGDSYIFGGYNTRSKPFSVDDATGRLLYNGVDMDDQGDPALVAEGGQHTEYLIAPGQRITVTLNGVEVMGAGAGNFYNQLNGLYEALTQDAGPGAISAYADTLQGIQTHLMSKVAEAGGKTNRLQLMANRYDQDEVNFAEIRSRAEDADVAEVMVEYNMAYAMYQYALQVGANMLSASLLDFIR